MRAAAGLIGVFVVVARSVERDDVVACLTVHSGVDVLGVAGNLEDALVRLGDSEGRTGAAPDVVLIDFQLPGRTGAQAVIALREALPQTRVVVLSAHATAPVMLSAFGAGAHGLVVKDSDPAVFGDAVHSVAEGGVFVDPRVAPSLVELAAKGTRARGPHDLTHQQMRVLERLAAGMTNREIAEELFLGPETIKSHVRQIMKKIGINNRAELARYATEQGLA